MCKHLRRVLFFLLDQKLLAKRRREFIGQAGKNTLVWQHSVESECFVTTLDAANIMHDISKRNSQSPKMFSEAAKILTCVREIRIWKLSKDTGHCGVFLNICSLMRREWLKLKTAALLHIPYDSLCTRTRLVN